MMKNNIKNNKKLLKFRMKVKTHISKSMMRKAIKSMPNKISKIIFKNMMKTTEQNLLDIMMNIQVKSKLKLRFRS